MATNEDNKYINDTAWKIFKALKDDVSDATYDLTSFEYVKTDDSREVELLLLKKVAELALDEVNSSNR